MQAWQTPFLKLEYVALGIPDVAPPATGRGAALQIANHPHAKRNQLLTGSLDILNRAGRGAQMR
jgi:hypothetical protein